MITQKIITAIKLRTVRYLVVILGAAIVFFSPLTSALARPLTESEMNLVNEIKKIFDIQVPGWNRDGGPSVRPSFKDDNLEGITTDVTFKSGGQAIIFQLSYPNKKEADRLIINYLKNISKEYAQKKQINGFEAILITPPVNQYETNISRLCINVANRFLLEIMGEEIMDPQTLIKAANWIDMKKLATLTK